MVRTTKPAKSGSQRELFRGTTRSRIVIVLAAALAVAALGPPGGAPASPTGSSDRVRVIVELDAPAALAARGHTMALASDRAEILEQDQAELLRHASGADVSTG